MKKLFSIVIPIYKAQENIPYTVPYIMENIPALFSDYRVELVLVNDGSPDNSWELMKEYQAKYPETIRLIRLIHNFGQGAAWCCGLSAARGDIVGIIAQDMQEPLELFADMLQAIENGADMACGVRSGREEKGLISACSKIAHWMMHTFVSPDYPAGGSDFFAMKRETVQRFLQLFPTYPHVLALLYAGESPVFLPYVRMKRQVGKSGYGFFKKMKIFIEMFISSTYLPLRAMTFLGFLCAGGAFCFALVILIASLTTGSPIPVRGWASLSILVTFFSGLILASIGIVGEYLWRVLDVVKKKPLYYVAETIEDTAKLDRNEVLK